MVKKIKKRLTSGDAKRTWLVGFDAQGQAGVYVHAHGTGDDHSACGPVVMCCEKARPPYTAFAPKMVERVVRWAPQEAVHLKGWFDNGLGRLYFCLCDTHDTEAFYFFGLDRPAAVNFLYGKTKLGHYRRADLRFTPADLPALQAEAARQQAELAAQQGGGAGNVSPAAPDAPALATSSSTEA